MPTLSVNFSTSEVSFLYAENPDNIKNYLFSYSGFTAEDEIKELFKIAAKEMQVSFAKCDIIITGFPAAPVLKEDIKASYTLDRILSGIVELNPVFVSHNSVVSADNFMCSIPSDYNSSSASNYFNNINIYPYLLTSESLQRFTLDSLIRYYPSELVNNSNPNPIVFTGDRFSFVHPEDAFTYLLFVDLVKKQGFFELQVDNQNILANMALLAHHDQVYSGLLSSYKFKKLGHLINSPGPLECLIETDEGTKQFVEVGVGELFMVPMDPSVKYRVSAKSSSLGAVERSIEGGILGLILDTRPKSNPYEFNPEYFEKNLKNWASLVREVVTQL
jgi:hypothetical protein